MNTFAIFRGLVALLLIVSAISARAAPVLVEGDWLASHLNQKNLVLIDMASDETQYSRFHLPGATHFPYYYLVRQNKKDKSVHRLPQKDLVQTLGQLGITKTDHVVIYDDMGGLNAARLFFELESIGHKEVSVLNGGLVKWILEGRKVVNSRSSRAPVKYGAVGKLKSSEATMADIDQAVRKKLAIIDARSREEYVGDLKKKQGGHIAGARWWEWSDSLDIAGGFTRQSPDQLQHKLATLGVTSKKQPVIAYCHTGHRAAQTYLTLRSLGYEKVRLYARSMSEYGVYRKDKLVRGLNP